MALRWTARQVWGDHGSVRRPILLFALTVLLTAAACGSAVTSPSPSPSAAAVEPSAGATSAAPIVAEPAAQTADPTASTTPAPDDTVWLCKPGVADNPCESNLDSTPFDAAGTAGYEKAAPAADPPIDCFYVYPTVSRQKTTNADLTIDPEERAVAQAQAARFSQVCRVFAPMYPQLTLAAIATPGKISYASALIAYNYVDSAFRNYMANYNHGRGIVFIGHSQGAMLLTGLLKYEVDTQPQVRKLLVSALLMGANITVPIGKTVGGDFQNIPACSSEAQTGCVVAYSSFAQTPPADAVFGRVATAINVIGFDKTASLQILCVNPASPSGGTATLKPYLPIGFLKAVFGTAGSAWGASTPFVSFPDQYAGHCENTGGASWLQIDRLGGASDKRPVVAASNQSWGLHTVDVNIALGNLVDLVRAEAAAYH
jgi:hypothetical protein